MFVFFDTETHRFRPGLMAPPIVCVQFCVDDGAAQLMTKRGEFAHQSGAISPATANTFSTLLAHWITQGATLVGHHVAYDLACFCAWDQALVPLVFRHYRESKVTDTMFRQKLADIGRGKHRGFQAPGGWVQLNYNLGDVGGRHGHRVDKNDPWRLHYNLLDDVPLDQWGAFSAWVPVLKKDVQQIDPVSGCPLVVQVFGEDAIRYALGDAMATRAAYCGQAARYPAELFVDEYQQARKFWALDLASHWGLRTSLRGVLSLEKGAREQQQHLGAMLLDARDENGAPAPLIRRKFKTRPEPMQRDTKRAKERMRVACAESGAVLRWTKGHDVCLDSDACKESGDPMLEAYAEYSSMSKVLSNDVEMLRKGVVVPIHTHYDLADTGRVTSAGPNVMNPRRLTGVRECYVPRGYRE
jgi:hypothetical protein